MNIIVNDKEKIRLQHRRKYWKRVEYYREKARLYYQKNKEADRERQRRYVLKNRVKRRMTENGWRKKAFHTNLNFRLRELLSNRVKILIKRSKGKKNNSTIILLGCSIQEFKEHIEKQFKPGMTWKNYGIYGWHLHHKKSCITFDLTKEEEQKKCFHYTNYQPLWAEEHLKIGVVK